MGDFNTTKSELIKRLRLSWEANGAIYWYDGTPDLLRKMMQFLPDEQRGDDDADD